MKNMKIEINAEQPLDEVVKELERLGCKRNGTITPKTYRAVSCNQFGLWHISFFEVELIHGELTTLQQLREMK